MTKIIVSIFSSLGGGGKFNICGLYIEYSVSETFIYGKDTPNVDFLMF